MWRALPLLGLLGGCGGLYSRNPDGGGNGGLGPPLCMRTFADAISISSPGGVNAFQDIQAVVFDKDRNLHVLSRSANDESYVDVLGHDFKFVRSYGKGKIGPTRDLIVATNGLSYLLEDPPPGPGLHPDVVRFDASGVFLGTWPATGGTEDIAQAFAFDGDGLLNIAGLSHLFRYQPNGVFVDQYAVAGKGPGKLLFATGLTYDPMTGSMWVADLFQNFIEKYTPGSDVQLLQFGGHGTGDGKFDGNEPTGNTFYGPGRIAIDAQGKIYANDPFASRIMKFAANGAYLGQFGFGGSIQVGAIAIDPMTGVLYVARGTSIDAVCPF